MGSACLLGQNVRQLGAQGGHALGRAEVIALHHAQNRLQRGLRIAPEVRLIAFSVYVLHIVDEVKRLTELKEDTGRCMLIARTFKSSLLQRWSAHLWQNSMTEVRA